MKKLFVLSALVLTVVTKNNAQVRVGVQAGLAKTSPTVSGLANPKGYIKVAPGLVFEFPMFAGLKFRPSTDYLRQQVESVSTISVTPTGGGAPQNVPYTTTLNFTNFQIPLDITLPIKVGKKGSKERVLITAGPVLNFTINGTRETSYTLPGASSLSITSNALSIGSGTVQYKGMDWGGRVGIGYRTKFGLDLMANYKLASDITNSNTTSQKNNVLSLTAAYFIVGGKK